MSYDIFVNRGRWGSKFAVEPPISDEHAAILRDDQWAPVFLHDDERAGYALEPEYYTSELPELHKQIVQVVRGIHNILGRSGVEVSVVEDHAYADQQISNARSRNASVMRQALGLE